MENNIVTIQQRTRCKRARAGIFKSTVLKIYYYFTCVFVFYIFSGCNNDLELFRVKNIKGNLDIEIYKSRGGVYGSDYYYYYLTDSNNFKEYVGKRDENGCISFGIVNDEIVYINKYRYRGKKGLIDSTNFNIELLKEKGEFEN